MGAALQATSDGEMTPDQYATAVLRHWIFEFLHYDPLQGAFTWITAPAPRFQVGEQAGSLNSKGYVVVRCFGRLYIAHRLAWLLFYGEWPTGDIDHINGNRSDNRIANLRDVTRSVNAQNLKRARSDNQSGLLGVKKARGNSFEARINLNGRYKHIGTFKTAADAHNAYLAAKRKHHQGCTI